MTILEPEILISK